MYRKNTWYKLELDTADDEKHYPSVDDGWCIVLGYACQGRTTTSMCGQVGAVRFSCCSLHLKLCLC